jgi:hypothetical protein
VSLPESSILFLDHKKLISEPQPSHLAWLLQLCAERELWREVATPTFTLLLHRQWDSQGSKVTGTGRKL